MRQILILSVKLLMKLLPLGQGNNDFSMRIEILRQRYEDAGVYEQETCKWIESKNEKLLFFFNEEVVHLGMSLSSSMISCCHGSPADISGWATVVLERPANFMLAKLMVEVEWEGLRRCCLGWDPWVFDSLLKSSLIRLRETSSWPSIRRVVALLVQANMRLGIS